MARRVERQAPRRTRRVAGRAGRVVDSGIPVAPRTTRRVVEEEIPVRSVVVEEPVDVVVDDPVVVRREAWSPAQIVSMAVGAALLLLGAVALARASGAGGLTGVEVSVAGFHHTGLLGLIELFVGLTLIGIGAVPGGAREVMLMFGVLLAGFGLLVAVAAEDLHHALATHGAHVVLYLLAGTLLIVSAAVSPLILPGTRRRVVEEPVVDLRDPRL